MVVAVAKNGSREDTGVEVTTLSPCPPEGLCTLELLRPPLVGLLGVQSTTGLPLSQVTAGVVVLTCPLPLVVTCLGTVGFPLWVMSVVGTSHMNPQ